MGRSALIAGASAGAVRRSAVALRTARAGCVRMVDEMSRSALTCAGGGRRTAAGGRRMIRRGNGSSLPLAGCGIDLMLRSGQVRLRRSVVVRMRLQRMPGLTDAPDGIGAHGEPRCSLSGSTLLLRFRE